MLGSKIKQDILQDQKLGLPNIILADRIRFYKQIPCMPYMIL